MKSNRKHSYIVVMVCGVVGFGKTICVQSLEKTGFVRLSIDEKII
jgi:predicted ATPase